MELATCIMENVSIVKHQSNAEHYMLCDGLSKQETEPSIDENVSTTKVRVKHIEHLQVR